MENKKPKLKNRKPGTFMNFLTDFAFKKIFENKKLLIDFLNEVLKEKSKVVSLNDLNLEQLGRTDNDRKAVYDIYCKSERDKYFIIEMQVFDELFKTARINKLKDEDMKLHDKSILEYADIKVCMRDTMELGMEKGMEKGRKTGFIEVAKNMLTLQYTINDIVRVTGLSQGEITALSN